MAENRSALIRNKIADYLDCGTGTEPDFRLMGIGFTQLDENPNAQSESTTYINEVTAQADITKYETEFPYNSDFIPDQKPVIKLYNDGRDHHVGSEAQHTYVRVDLWNSVGDVTDTKAEYKARRFTVSNEVSDITGEGGNKIQVSGTLKAMGDPVQGKFDVIARTFTEGAFEGKYDKDDVSNSGGGDPTPSG